MGKVEERNTGIRHQAGLRTAQTPKSESLRHVLNLLPYNGKDEAPMRLAPDPNVIMRFHRKMVVLDL